MAYRHGIFTSEVPTSIIPPVEVDSGLIFAIGTAPVHLAANPAPPHKPVLCYSFDEAVSQFGLSDDFNQYTLSEVISSQFQLFGMSPIVLVNVLDTQKHFKSIDSVEVGGIISTPAVLDAPIILDTLKITTSGGNDEVDLIENTHFEIVENTQDNPDDNYYTINIVVDAVLPSENLIIAYTDSESNVVTESKILDDLPFDLPVGASNIELKVLVPITKTLIKDVDYTAAYNSDGQVVITILKPENVTDDLIKLAYNEVDTSKVTKADIIGGIDLVTGKNNGLELVEEIFPRFRLCVGTIIAPKWSEDPTVAAVMKTKCTNINGCFRAIAIVDIPSDEVKTYTEAAEWKNLKNLVDTSITACYPKVSLGGVQYHLSTQLASLINKVDSQWGAPHKSPSNENLQCDSSVIKNGDELFLTLDKAQYLNGQGIVTALNFSQGWVAYGNRTSAYPSSTDPRESFLPVRRVFNWLSNQLILTYFSKLDYPLNKRLIESVLDSVNIYLNGLTARGIINGGRIEFLSSENTKVDLMDGIVRFHLYITPPSPARALEFTLEYDPDYLTDLLV